MSAAVPEPDRSAEHSGTSGGPKAGTAEGQHLNRMCRRQRRNQDQQPGVDLAYRKLRARPGCCTDLLVGQ